MGYKTRRNYVEAVTWQAESNFFFEAIKQQQLAFEKVASYASFRLLTKAKLAVFPLPIRLHKFKLKIEN